MNEYRFLGAILVWFFCGSTVRYAYAQTVEPSLSETLGWIDSTYNDHSKEGGSPGNGEFRTNDTDARLFNRVFGHIAFDGCRVTLRNKDDPNAPLYSKMQSTEVLTFNLRDIDPDSGEIQRFASAGGLPCQWASDSSACDTGFMYYSTHNNAPLIDERSDTVFAKLTGRDHETKLVRKTFVATIYFDSLDYAARFNKAFNHAILLCGGKPSPFWPFNLGVYRRRIAPIFSPSSSVLTIITASPPFSQTRTSSVPSHRLESMVSTASTS